MTMPFERTRAIVETRAFLQRLLLGSAVPRRLRYEAASLLRHFPGDGDINVIATAFPQSWASIGSWAENAPSYLDLVSRLYECESSPRGGMPPSAAKGTAQSAGTAVTEASVDHAESDATAESARHWLLENAPALDLSNEFVERHGVPCANARTALTEAEAMKSEPPQSELRLARANVDGTHSMETEFDLDDLPDTLRPRDSLQAVLYIAERYGVAAVRIALDPAVGFHAALEYCDAPCWHEDAAEFNYLVDGMLQQLIEYVYVWRLKVA